MTQFLTRLLVVLLAMAPLQVRADVGLGSTNITGMALGSAEYGAAYLGDTLIFALKRDLFVVDNSRG